MAPNRYPECPDGSPAKGPAPFNAHSRGGGGSGLVQSVFRSPARPPAWVPLREGSCAAPPSEKRSTLSRANPMAGLNRPATGWPQISASEKRPAFDADVLIYAGEESAMAKGFR